MSPACLIEQYLLDHPLYGVFRVEGGDEENFWGFTTYTPIRIVTDKHYFICSIALIGPTLHGRVGFWAAHKYAYDMAEDLTMPEPPYVELIHSRNLGKITEPKVFENIDNLIKDFINEVDEWINLKIRYTTTFGGHH